MTKDTLISMEQLESVLDYSPITIIISALDNRELLYANKAAGFRTSPACRYGRMTCYQAFGRDCPCPGCPGSAGMRSSFWRIIIKGENIAYILGGNDGCYYYFEEHGNHYRMIGSDWTQCGSLHRGTIFILHRNISLTTKTGLR